VVPYVILNIVLDCLVVVGIVGLLMWSVVTQYRDHACESLRLRRGRLQTSVRLLPREAPQTRPGLADPPPIAPGA
jgi:hypothetical protein